MHKGKIMVHKIRINEMKDSLKTFLTDVFNHFQGKK